MGYLDVLYAFIRLGLGVEDAFFPGKINWKLLYQIASEQGILPIVAEGISHKLSQGATLEGLDDVLRQRIAYDLILSEQNYLSIWKSVKILSELYHEEDIKIIALKGFVTSSFYPKPQQRSFCDFDCFLSDFDKGNDIVRQRGIEVMGSYKHATFDFETAHVENHHFCTHFRGRKKAYEFEMLLQKYMLTDSAEYLQNSYIEKPSPLFNALFLTYHARSHFFDERVSLRQVVDWAMLMRYYGNSGLNWKNFLEICQEFGLLTFAQTMSRLGQQICHVDIPFDCPTNDILDKMILDDIFSDVQVHVEYGTGMRARWQVLQNKCKGRWKYQYFSNQSFVSAICQQIWGYIAERNPTRSES